MAKKYYWMKLKEDFFDEDAISWLEEQPKGKAYALFYLKLCLKSLKTNGILVRNVGTMLVPYDPQKLSEITKTEFDTVVVAMELLKNIGLIELLENGEIYLPRIIEMVGSETDKALLMRKKRELDKKILEVGGNNVTEPLPNCYTEIRDRDIDKDIDQKIFVEPSAKQTQEAHKNPVGDFEMQCVEIIIKSCIDTFPNSKVPQSDADKSKWGVEIERLKRLDGRSESEIIEAITYATTDSFWKSNIRSTKKFREKFETLIVRSREKAEKNKGVQTQKSANKFNNFNQRQYDYDKLESQLLQCEMNQ